MELIDQHTKRIMEGCKQRAREAGLRFQDETLEYIVTNRDLLELAPKVMIPTLYDYWVHDVEILKEKGKYELYPVNPYETVINTRPPISFYNDNNPDWLNVMIFYHVLAHIDFFQNNLYFRHTWEYDFTGQALADKRLLAKLRSEKGRWVDYVIEFARSIDNLVGYFQELSHFHRASEMNNTRRMDYYFDVFIQDEKKLNIGEYIKEIERYNENQRLYGPVGEDSFFADVERKYPEFEAMFKKYQEKKVVPRSDLMQFLLDHSEVLNKEGNRWMKTVLQVVRNTSVFFQPQIRTKIMNEGWASYWHEVLFLGDDRINGHEVDFARVNAGVTSMSRVGLNPYALGMRLFQYIEESADKGKYSQAFQTLLDARQRDIYDQATGKGREFIFQVRENLSDFQFANIYIDQDFINRHRLFVVGKRLSQDRMVYQYYVKSRKAEDYRQMVLDQLYHPPYILIDNHKTAGGELYLIHRFEDKPLVTEYIPNTLMGLEYLWGGPVHLETSEVSAIITMETTPYSPTRTVKPDKRTEEPEIKWQRVLYTMKDRKLTKRNL
ncbi:MAG: SpoVR family protein [Deltaproteobacteria bacterium]|nr:SpoVR family protein [Deltaproteobacteria bacterium]